MQTALWMTPKKNIIIHKTAQTSKQSNFEEFLSGKELLQRIICEQQQYISTDLYKTGNIHAHDSVTAGYWT